MVLYEQKALATIFSVDANPEEPTPELQLELADDFLATARASKESLESWLVTPSSTKVSNFINDMLMFMTTGIYLAKEWRLVVKESDENWKSDKVFRDSIFCQFISFFFESCEKTCSKGESSCRLDGGSGGRTVYAC